MNVYRLHAPSVLSGCGLALLALGALSWSRPAPAPEWDYKIMGDVDAKDLTKLAADGWEFAGYLGQGDKGIGYDETLWKRAAD